MAYCRKGMCKLCGVEPLVITRARQPALLLFASVGGERLREGTVPLPSFWRFPCTHPISSHFTRSPYVIGTLPAVALMLHCRVGGFEYILTHVGPLRGVSWKSGSFFCCLNPHWFLQPEFMRIYLPGTGTLGCVLWPWAQIAHSQVIHHTWKWDCPFHCPFLCMPQCISLPPHLSLCLHHLLPIWTNVASLNPWLLDFHTVQFSDSSGCYLFWGLVVILSVVVQGAGACLPTPPLWLEVQKKGFLMLKCN